MELSERIESLFDLKISSSGNDITIKLGGEQMTVDYEAFLELRKSIERVVVSERQRVIDHKLPNTITMTWSRKVTDIERFASAHMGIDLMPQQLRYIQAIIDGKTLFYGRMTGKTTARNVLREYVNSDTYIKHFDRTHFTAVTVDDRPFVYCPIGNIVSWSKGDHDNGWCHHCKRFFSDIKIENSMRQEGIIPKDDPRVHVKDGKYHGPIDDEPKQ